jgi:hypothetical protein
LNGSLFWSYISDSSWQKIKEHIFFLSNQCILCKKKLILMFWFANLKVFLSLFIIPHGFIISPYHQSSLIHILPWKQYKVCIRNTSAMVGLLHIQSFCMGFWWCLLFWEEEDCVRGGSSFILFGGTDYQSSYSREL